MELCYFCKEPVDTSSRSQYPQPPAFFKQATLWLAEPKWDGGTLREYTGQVAHSGCIDKAKRAIPPDQLELL